MLIIFVIIDIVLIFIGLGILGLPKDYIGDRARAISLILIVVFIVFSIYDNPLIAFWNFLTRKVI